jgi:HK97 family phage major capsid protein
MAYISTLETTEGIGSASKEHIFKLGKVMVEALKKKGVDVREELAKRAGVAKEALTIAETDVFSTAIAGFIEKRLTPELATVGAIKEIAAPGKGYDSIKIPMRNALVTAQDLGDTGQVSYDSGSHTSTTITLRYVYAAQEITHELLQFANVDLLAEELGEIGDAIARKVDSDVIAAFKTNTTTTIGNLTQLGSTTEVTFASLVSGLQKAKENYAKPDLLIVSPETEATIIALGNLSGTTNVIGSMVMKGDEGTNYPLPNRILGMKVIVSQQVDDDDIYMVDSARTGYLCRRNGVEAFDGRKSGYLSFEVIGAHAYGVGIVQPKAVYRLEENAGA